MTTSTLARTINNVLNAPTISRVRRNHALEHATVHLLNQRMPGLALAGHSDPGGFWIIGEVDTEHMAAAVTEALERLRSGERHLAIHPHCGTNLVTNAVVAGGFASLAWIGGGTRKGSRMDRILFSILLALAGLFVSLPLGYRIQQRITTDGNPRDLRVVQVLRSQQGNFAAHRITTEG